MNGVESPDVDCEPLQGRVLVFQHNIMHEGAHVEEGVKYTIRTDVEYGPEVASAWLVGALGFGAAAKIVSARLARCMDVVSLLVVAAIAWYFFMRVPV